MGNIFHIIFIQPIINLLVGFYKIYTTIGLPGAFGFAILSITVLVRIVLHPFFKQQMQTAKKMQEIKPHMDRLSKKHKNDAKKLQAEQMKLYQQHGINPAAGCLFAIVQIPIFIGLYQTLRLFLSTSGVNLVKQINAELYSQVLKIQSIDPHFFGLNLALSPAKSGSIAYILIPIITGILQYFQNKITLPQPPKVEEPKDGKEKKEPSTSDEFQKAMNTQMKYFLPVMIGYFSYTLPIGLSLYWNIFSIFSIIQYTYINRDKAGAVVKEVEKEVENVLEGK